ncbi:MAG: carbon-nitrogen hydrolase family protein [Gammaproteobacteria bacterium]|nr:MAG: carbon-nitrogen hydrolase family protein [Gammaproteobacteria bacterium]
MNQAIKVAIVQESPVFLDKTRTLDRAVEMVKKAAAQHASLVVFPEAYISGYPAWIWRLRPGGDWNLSESLHRRLLHNAVNLEKGDLDPLYQVARKHKVTIVCGMNEQDSKGSRSTLYNSVVVIGENGQILNHHRKLMPTNPERMVWGFGDGSGLRVVDTPCGRLGTLICWENYMPLARYALYGQGVEIYIAPTYDSGEGWTGTLQHIAREGRCWVLGAGVPLQRTDLPDDFPEKDTLYPESEDWINPGDSVVIAPGGEIISGPMKQRKGLLLAEIDPERAVNSRRALDICGHYARPDIFTLQVNRNPQNPVRLTGPTLSKDQENT